MLEEQVVHCWTAKGVVFGHLSAFALQLTTKVSAEYLRGPSMWCGSFEAVQKSRRLVNNYSSVLRTEATHLVMDLLACLCMPVPRHHSSLPIFMLLNETMEELELFCGVNWGNRFLSALL